MSHVTEHRPPNFTRHCDVVIVGASAAGLAAGLQLSRQCRSVIVVDSGEPRNAAAPHIHGYLGHDGIVPGRFAAVGREEVRSYGGEVIEGRAVALARTEDGYFRIDLVGGHTVVARRLLVATGLVDELPKIEGLSRHWGGQVIHCPFCHGYEVRNRRLVQIITYRMGLHNAALFRQLTGRLTVVLHDGVDPDDPALAVLRAGGVEVIDQRVERLVDDPGGRLVSVELVDGTQIEVDAVVVSTRFRARAELLLSLGIEPTTHVTELGDVVAIDQSGQTSVPGVFAAGNVTDPSQQVSQAAAQGSWVGAMIASQLAADDLRDGVRPSALQADWDHRYSGDQIWSGNPNGTLLQEVVTMAPSRALDVGAGEGGDAVWLAAQGWHVVASEISTNALNRIERVAAERSLAIETLHVDANVLTAFTPEGFDLVTAHYASISPHTRQSRDREPNRRSCSQRHAARGGP